MFDEKALGPRARKNFKDQQSQPTSATRNPQVPEGVRVPGDHLVENTPFDAKDTMKCICRDCGTSFFHAGDLNKIPRTCVRCERHSKIYGLVWPKTILRADDSEIRIMNPDDVIRTLSASEYKQEIQSWREALVEAKLRDMFKRNMRKANRKRKRSN